MTPSSSTSLLLICCYAWHGVPASQPANRPGTNKLKATPHDVHDLILDETAEVFRQGTTDEVTITTRPAGVTIRRDRPARPAEKMPYRAMYTSRPILTDFPFNEVIPAWNIDVPPGTGFVVELRVGRSDDDFWTGFYYLGRWGNAPPTTHKMLRDASGVIEIDYFRSHQSFDRLQYRVHLAAVDPDASPVLRRFTLAVSNTLNDERLARRYRKPIDPGPKHLWARRLPVPFKSQKDVNGDFGSRVCSPVAAAMVLAYRGVEPPISRVCHVLWDEEYRIFGNWARAVQGAYTFGLPGYVERFGHWDAVKRHIANDQPIIASIRADPGQLRGAPYRATTGHLLVITGFDHAGNVHVNDPAGATPADGTLTYAKPDMETVWLAHGGVGYVLLEATTEQRPDTPHSDSPPVRD